LGNSALTVKFEVRVISRCRSRYEADLSAYVVSSISSSMG
jgi:hypothetical protein